ncbi:MAG: type I-C CRISPR-associated protein Cas8c/Csd1 [Acidiphilium sp.]|nr:type I-C CRISPR-associated protein Cas8c/Csd1 [Acidiphilium sp.]MDD4936745.1 type I-C CRISPR-associated protein Cas8c/Csd1 [Acidiphilium sp.]
MTVLQSLDKYYDRMAERGDADPPGYSRKSIDFCIWLNADGSIANVNDLNDYTGKKPVARHLAVPQEVIRTSGVSSNFLWDKTAYALGVGKDKDKKSIRYAEKEHEAFKLLHTERLANTDDIGLRALLAFLAKWTPEKFESDARFTTEMLDKNVIFGLAGGKLEYLHDRPAARALITAPREVWKTAFCLVTGIQAPIERLHPSIQGVDGAQSSGARLVSYNADAFTSYGADSGANAPTSEPAAFRYGTALNRLLDRGSSNRLKIGDATVAFWADSEGVGEAAAAAAEDLFGDLIDPPSDEAEAQKIRDVLVEIKKLQPLQGIDPKLEPTTRFHILGLSPNAARLSVRYWMTDEFGNFARRLAQHYEDILIDPAPWRAKLPSVQILLLRTTSVQEKFENIPPHLAGEVARAILEGLPYPRTLLTAAMMRLRAGDAPHTGWHAAVIKACINRSAKSEKEKLPVSRDPDNECPAYQLGRLFAVLEAAQYAALGRVNASIVDRYYGAASATPARVFGPLLRNVRNHVSDATKRGKGKWIEARLNEIMSKLDPNLPKTLKLEDQGRFAVGYYHERAWRGPGQSDVETSETVEEETP